MEFHLPTDEDTNKLFEDAADKLRERFGYTIGEAEKMTLAYFTHFQDPEYCDRIGVPVQDEDFFHHEGQAGLAFRIHYYMGLKGDPNPMSFIDWRADFQKRQ
jgi:hypothetical protein